MLQLKNTNGGYGDETAIRADNVAITQTLGSLSTLQFSFVADEMNAVGADMMVPRTIITEPETGQMFRIVTSNPVPSSKYRTYTITAKHVGGDLHDIQHEERYTATQTLKKCMDLVVKGTDFNYKIEDDFSNYSFSESFGTGYADDLLQQLANDFKFEYYFDNYTIHIAKSIGKTGAFLFVDGTNVSKISVNEDYSTLTTYMKGYAGKPDEKTGVYPISASYTSPLASQNHWGTIWGDIYTNENMTKRGLEKALKEKVHDYPDVQYSLEYVNFRKNLQGFNNDSSVGNYGYLRDRYGIDVQVRVQSRTIYPQDSKNSGSITFGNTTFDPIVLQNQLRKGWQDNVKLGKTLKRSVNDASDKAIRAWNSRLLAQPVVSRSASVFSRSAMVQANDEDDNPVYALTLPADNPLELPEGTQIPVETNAKAVKGLEKAIQKGQAIYGIATPDSNGLMSADDKSKLNNLKEYQLATPNLSGLMSKDDKTKLDSLNSEPVKSIKIIDSKTKMTYQLTVVDGQIELTEVDR